MSQIADLTRLEAKRDLFDWMSSEHAEYFVEIEDPQFSEFFDFCYQETLDIGGFRNYHLFIIAHACIICGESFFQSPHYQALVRVPDARPNRKFILVLSFVEGVKRYIMSKDCRVM